jgi:hypothetical protein
LKTEASELASLGLRLFPIKGKAPAVKNWPGAATTDPANLSKWFGGSNPPNVGVATGGDLLVLDVDVREGGFDSFWRFVDGRELPETAACESGAGGYHHYFRIPEGLGIRSRTDLLPGLDIKCEGGYVVTAPSIHPETGREYEWASHPRDGIADAPDWMISELVTPERRRPAEGAPITQEYDGDREELLAEAVRRFPVERAGQRNEVMLRLVCSLLGQNYSGYVVRDVVTAWWVHFHALGKISTPPARARVDVNATIMAVLRRGTLSQSLEVDHRAESRKVELTPAQIAWVDSVRKTAQERAYLEALIIHAAYELSKPHRKYNDRFPATRDQIRQIMVDRGSSAPHNPQMEVLKGRFVSRPGQPAGRVEALVETEKGRTGKPSWFRLAGLPVDSIDRQTPPVAPEHSKPSHCVAFERWASPG